MLIFLDVDGVLNDNTRGVNPEYCRLLDLELSSKPGYSIVLNSAWSALGLDHFLNALPQGLVWPKYLVGTTGNPQGGGEWITSYFEEHQLFGCPFVTIDDSSHGYDWFVDRHIIPSGTSGRFAHPAWSADHLDLTGARNALQKELLRRAERFLLPSEYLHLNPSQREALSSRLRDVACRATSVGESEFRIARLLDPPDDSGESSR